MQYKTIKSRGESKYNPQLDEREIAICASPSASLNGEMLTRVNKRRLRCVYLHCAKLSRKKKEEDEENFYKCFFLFSSVSMRKKSWRWNQNETFFSPFRQLASSVPVEAQNVMR